MASWELVPCGVQLRSEVNALAPNRDKTTDGTIGDTAHQQSSSDHNDDEVGKVPIRDADSKHEVHAWDADRDLREEGLTMEMIVQHILGRCRSGAEKRLRYIIFNKRIWSASTGWKLEVYNGASPHTEHAHFSFSYETAREADTSSWKLEEIPVAMTKADLEKIGKMIKDSEERLRKEFTEIPADVWSHQRDISNKAGVVNMAEMGNVQRSIPGEHGGHSQAIGRVETALAELKTLLTAPK